MLHEIQSLYSPQNSSVTQDNLSNKPDRNIQSRQRVTMCIIAKNQYRMKLGQGFFVIGETATRRSGWPPISGLPLSIARTLVDPEAPKVP